MSRDRTQKKLSSRIDRAYFKKPHGWRRTRMALVFLASAAAIGFVAWTASGRAGGSSLIHNPGHLTSFHAHFENNCAACHDGVDARGEKKAGMLGKFSKSVSDAACLKCHDGAMHHPNQATMFVDDPRRTPPGKRSADCVSCHTEHRGRDALVGTNDMHCTQCHADLSAGKVAKALAANDPRAKVGAFTPADHPHFGRSLRPGGGSGGPLADPTVLRFNHKKHFGILKGEQQNCIWCHNPSASAGEALTWEIGKTAYALPGAATAEAPRALADGSSRHRSLTQVNYNANCKSCHDLGTLPNSEMAIPHAEMAVVRKVLLAYIAERSSPWQKIAPDKPGKEKPLNDRIAAKLGESFPPDSSAVLDAVSAAVKESPLSAAPASDSTDAKLSPELVKKLQTALDKMKPTVLPKADKERVQAAVGATTRPSEHVRPAVIAALRDEVAKSGGTDKEKLLRQFDAAFSRFNQETPDPRLLQAYVTFANGGGVSCVKCHDTQGDAAVVPAEWSSLRGAMRLADSATPPSTSPAQSAALAFETKPTGIPAGPRRWYVNSEFSHDAHRNMNCVECHAAALNSEKTSDVLSPDSEWQGLRYREGSSGAMEVAARSCFECHHAEDSEHGPGAPANCTECHTFHDRTKEREPDAAPKEVLDGKVFPSGKPPEVAASKP